MSSLEQHAIDDVTRHLRESRTSAGLTLRELARRAGTSHSTLLAYETGRKIPAVTTYLRILEAAGFAADIVTSRSVRVRDGINRGEELAAVLKLAEQFPANMPRQMNFPRFPDSIHTQT